MNKKIIFWIDDGHINFGIAKFLQEKCDYDLFAVYDLNYITKKFYQNQKLVNFNKVWFWRNYLSPKPHKPDLEYLKEFERKYKINLWLLAISERNFYRFNKFHKFSHDEILSITEDECKIFEKILDEVKPDFLVIGITDLHRNHLFKELCQSKGIRVLMWTGTRFASRTVISSNYDTIDNFDASSIQLNEKIPSKENLLEYINKHNPKKAINNRFVNREIKLGIKKILERHIKFLFICNNEYRKFYENWEKTKLRFLLSKEFTIPLILTRWYREKYLDKNSIKNFSTEDQFIYYPLQHEPERTLLMDAPFFTNQLEIISQIAKSIPVGHKLFVKEHFSMRRTAWRERSYYKKILDLPNVQLVHPSVESNLLLKNCSMVATVTGTTALEAGFYQKPSIVFSDSIYSYLPFITRVRNFEELPSIIRSSLEKKFDYSTINHYLKLMTENSFDVDPQQLHYDVLNQLQEYGGLLKEVDISPTKMESFLNSHRKELEKLSSEYIKKIKQYEKSESQR